METLRFKTPSVVKIHKLGAVSNILINRTVLNLSVLARAIFQGYSLKGQRHSQGNVQRAFEDGRGGWVG